MYTTDSEISTALPAIMGMMLNIATPIGRDGAQIQGGSPSDRDVTEGSLFFGEGATVRLTHAEYVARPGGLRHGLMLTESPIGLVLQRRARRVVRFHKFNRAAPAPKCPRLNPSLGRSLYLRQLQRRGYIFPRHQLKVLGSIGKAFVAILHHQHAIRECSTQW